MADIEPKYTDIPEEVLPDWRPKHPLSSLTQVEFEAVCKMWFAIRPNLIKKHTRGYYVNQIQWSRKDWHSWRPTTVARYKAALATMKKADDDNNSIEKEAEEQKVGKPPLRFPIAFNDKNGYRVVSAVLTNEEFEHIVQGPEWAFVKPAIVTNLYLAKKPESHGQTPTEPFSTWGGNEEI